jgi:hypothetical protein
MRHPTILAVVGAIVAVIALASPASAWQQPYGGCEEGTLAPHSAGANQCRAHGWTIMRRLAVNPHGVVVGSGLPHCRNEDGSGQASACSWNFHDGTRDGNGRGLSYWVGRNDRIHYVWPRRAGSPWRNVGGPLADALSEGERPYRYWLRCRTTGTDHPVIRIACPDGRAYAY